jgi:hypothetical protein
LNNLDGSAILEGFVLCGHPAVGEFPVLREQLAQGCVNCQEVAYAVACVAIVAEGRDTCALLRA